MNEEQDAALLLEELNGKRMESTCLVCGEISRSSGYIDYRSRVINDEIGKRLNPRFDEFGPAPPRFKVCDHCRSGSSWPLISNWYRPAQLFECLMCGELEELIQEEFSFIRSRQWVCYGCRTKGLPTVGGPFGFPFRPGKNGIDTAHMRKLLESEKAE